MELTDYLPFSLQATSTLLNAGSQIERARAGQLVAQRRKVASDFEAKQQEIAASESSGVAMRMASCSSGSTLVSTT